MAFFIPYIFFSFFFFPFFSSRFWFSPLVTGGVPAVLVRVNTPVHFDDNHPLSLLSSGDCNYPGYDGDSSEFITMTR